MAQSVMYFGIGIFVAALLGLLVVVHVHYRERLGSADQFRADIRMLEQQLAVALAERSKLQREIAAIKRDAEKTWTTERIESALFRERINDVADEVARITRTLDSPGSLIEPVSGNVPPVTGTKREIRWLAIDSASGDTCINTGALADRIRGLRTVASRAVNPPVNGGSLRSAVFPPPYAHRRAAFREPDICPSSVRR
jgi:chorismate mutase